MNNDFKLIILVKDYILSLEELLINIPNKDYYNKMEDIIKKELKEIEKESIDNQEKYKQAIEKV